MRTKKYLSGASIVLLGMLLLSACGSGSGKANEQQGGTSAVDSSPQTEQTEPAAASGTRLVKHMMGETEIPADPKRVITTQYTNELLALGVKLAGAPQWHLDQLDLVGRSEDKAGAADIGVPPSLEKITALSPELIIGQNSQEEIYDSLGKIAPTVLIPWGDENIYERLKRIGEVMGRQAEADQWIADHEAKAAEGRNKIASFVGEKETFVIVVVGG